MRTAVGGEEIGRLWVKQSQPEARASNQSFRGEKAFSYSTVIGQIVRDKAGRRVYLLNDSKYSDTTTMHQNRLRSAIPKYGTVVFVPGVSRWSSESFFDHKRILSELEDHAISIKTEMVVNRLDGKRLTELQRSRLLNKVQLIEKQAKRYRNVFAVEDKEARRAVKR